MRTAIAMFACAAWLTGSARAAEEAVVAEPRRPSDWQVAVGLGAMVMPAYPGASALQVTPLPLLDVRYGDRFFASVRGVGLNLIAERDYHVGISLVPSFGRREGADARLRGWGSILATADARLFADYRVGVLLFGASVRREIGGSEGMLADATTGVFLPLGRRFAVNASATVTWANARYTGAYFGVTPEQSSAALAGGVQLPSYAASSGLRDIAFSLLGNWQIDRHWGIQALVGEATLLGAASSSPLTQQRVQLMTGAFLAYAF